VQHYVLFAKYERNRVRFKTSDRSPLASAFRFPPKIEPGSSDQLSETLRFGSNPGALRMFSYTPIDLRPGSPLVVVLHGCGQSAADYVEGVGWATLADRLGFVVLAPEQTRSNNPNGCFNWFQPVDTTRDSGEAASIRQMIETAVAEHGLDREWIFVTGLSAGGAMASVMLAVYPDLFAGGAIIAGLPYGAAHNVQEALASMRQPPSYSGRAWGDQIRGASMHKGAWPTVSVWHGSADTTVTPANADATIAQWLDVHGLAQTTSVKEQINGHRRRVWYNVEGRPVVESYAIAGMAHGSPISSGSAGDQCGVVRPFILEAGISSAYRIAEFWGLTTRKRSSTASDYKEVETLRSEAESHRRGFRIQDVISKALKAAGLGR
jgi:feruloyl esterase